VTSSPTAIECITNSLAGRGQFDIVSARDIFVCNGANLYVTHDAAKSWQTIKPNIDFDRTSSHGEVYRIDFVDARHGWAVIYDNFPHPKYYLYETSDAGQIGQNFHSGFHSDFQTVAAATAPASSAALKIIRLRKLSVRTFVLCSPSGGMNDVDDLSCGNEHCIRFAQYVHAVVITRAEGFACRCWPCAEDAAPDGA